MNRIIKFRARIKENGKPKMFYQDDLYKSHQYLNSFLRRVTSFLAYEVDGEDGRHESYLEDFALEKSLDLFTGLLDRNGKEIYEGDVVKGYLPNATLEPTEVISPVSFEEGSFIFLKLNGEPMTLREIIKISNKKEVNFSGVEIIGNVWENPELLSSKKNI